MTLLSNFNVNIEIIAYPAIIIQRYTLFR